MAGQASRSFDAPHTLVPTRKYAEGTPNIYVVSADRSHIDVGFHYFRQGKVDRQARGVLTGFADWSTRREPQIDQAIASCGGGPRARRGPRRQSPFRATAMSAVVQTVTPVASPSADSCGAAARLGCARLGQLALSRAPPAAATGGGARWGQCRANWTRVGCTTSADSAIPLIVNCSP